MIKEYKNIIIQGQVPIGYGVFHIKEVRKLEFNLELERKEIRQLDRRISEVNSKRIEELSNYKRKVILWKNM